MLPLLNLALCFTRRLISRLYAFPPPLKQLWIGDCSMVEHVVYKLVNLAVNGGVLVKLQKAPPRHIFPIISVLFLGGGDPYMAL